MSGLKFGEGLYLTLKTRVISDNYNTPGQTTKSSSSLSGRLVAGGGGRDSRPHLLPVSAIIMTFLGSWFERRNLWTEFCRKRAARGVLAHGSKITGAPALGVHHLPCVSLMN